MTNYYKDIGAILDLECFAHGSNFWKVREIGFIQTQATAKPSNFQVHPGKLPEAGYRTFTFTKYNVHGLNFYPTGHFLRQDEVQDTIVHLWELTGRKLIGYKGGIFEKKLLDVLNIPCINLETLSTTEVPLLPYRKVDSNNEFTHFSCGNHTYCVIGNLHCASCEVAYYNSWYNEFAKGSF